MNEMCKLITLRETGCVFANTTCFHDDGNATSDESKGQARKFATLLIVTEAGVNSLQHWPYNVAVKPVRA